MRWRKFNVAGAANLAVADAASVQCVRAAANGASANAAAKLRATCRPMSPTAATTTAVTTTYVAVAW